MQPIINFVVKNAEAIAVATAAAVGGFIAGANKDRIKDTFSRGKKKSTTKRRTRAKRTNTKKASGNRKAQAKKTTKKKATARKKTVGEKAAEVTS